jgi:hypothetical protein
MRNEEGSSGDEGGRKGHNLVGSCFEDPDDGTCNVAGYGEDDDSARIMFYKLPGGEEVYGLSRRCVLGFWHIGRPTRGSAGTIDVPV